MSHDEMNGRAEVSRKARRAAFGGKRKPVVRRPFAAADHIRNDWTPDELILFMEGRAHGYVGLLREFLCTAAHQLRAAGAEIDRLEAEANTLIAKRNETEEALDEARMELLDETEGGFAE